VILLSAKPVTEALSIKTRARVDAFRAKHGRAPKLVVVLVGEDPASVIYTTHKGKAATAAGMEHETVKLAATSSAADVRAVVKKLDADPNVDGILIQRPLPPSFREEEVVYWISPAKDVDAFHPENTGKLSLGLPCLQPCTPSGIVAMLDHYKIHLRGKLACVIGRSSIVGKPMAALLLRRDMTILHCHSKTPNLAAISSQADVVVAAIGKAELIGPEHIKEGAVVVDVGMNRLATGKLVGDVAFDAVSGKASAITPVPGGVGPMTIAWLLQNTVQAAEMREKAL
jgi:methylenetetrahydrofolate dehydrogenase (NADP+)/methenyltetrahydrofolate cyclohydrolase